MPESGMTKGKFEAVRELLKLGRLSEARAILETIDHPKAHELLKKITEAQLSQLYQPQPKAPEKDRRQRSSARRSTFNWAIGGMVLAGFLAAWIVITVIRDAFDTNVTLNATPAEPPPTLFDLPVIEVSPTATESSAQIDIPSLPTVTPESATVTPALTVTPRPFVWDGALQARSACEEVVNGACSTSLTLPHAERWPDDAVP